MSTTALFYPHVSIVSPRLAGQSQDYERTDTRLLTTALLLWDQLEVIVPHEGFPLEPKIGPKQEKEEHAIREAFAMVVRPRVLKDSEKGVLYKRLKSLIGDGIPDYLRFDPKLDNYKMYPQKLDTKTWELIKEAGLTDENVGYYGLQRDFGLVLMGLIADICAGGTRKKVTNYPDAHEAYIRLITAQNGATPDFQADTQRAYTLLATMSLKSIDTNRFSLENLVKLRKRETQDGLLPPLRQNYRAAVEKYVDRLKNEAKSQSDVEQIENEFQKSIRDDFRHLEAMLGLERSDARTAVWASVLMAVNPLNWPNLVGSASKAFPSYKVKKQAALEKHISAWLYSV